MPDFNVANYRGDGQLLQQERKAGKRESARLNPVLTNNQYKDLDFPDYEFQSYPKMIPVPVPMAGELPDEDELPNELRRKVREREDENGQILVNTESDKNWLRRVNRLWCTFYHVAQNPAHEAEIRKDWGLTPVKGEKAA